MTRVPLLVKRSATRCFAASATAAVVLLVAHAAAAAEPGQADRARSRKDVATKPRDLDRIAPWSGEWINMDKQAAKKTTGEILSIRFTKKNGDLSAEITYGPLRLIGGNIGESHTETHLVRCCSEGRETIDGDSFPAQAMFEVSHRAATMTYMLESGGKKESGGWSLWIKEFREAVPGSDLAKSAGPLSVRRFEMIRP